MVLVVIFFFKQKTAYEVRISDWSSDVCSSVLVAGRMFDHIALKPPVNYQSFSVFQTAPAGRVAPRCLGCGEIAPDWRRFPEGQKGLPRPDEFKHAHMAGEDDRRDVALDVFLDG